MFNRLKDSILEVLKSRLFVLIVVFCILSANFDSACILFTDCKRGRLPEQLQIEDSKDKNHPRN